MIKSLIILTLVIGFLTLNSGFVRAQEASTKESLKTALQKIAGQKAIIEQIDQFTQVKEKAPSEQTEEPSEDKAIEADPVMEIKRLDSEKPLYSFELRDTPLADLFRVLAHDYKLNLLVDKEVEGTVTASLSNISLEEALETIAESQNLSLIKKKNVIRVGLNLITRIFSLKYIEAKDMLKMSSSSASSFEGAVVENQAGALQEAESESGLSESADSSMTNTIHDLLSPKGKILLGRQPNSIMVIDYPPNVEKIACYIEEIDKKMESRLFKLKYLRATDVVGEEEAVGSSSSNDESSSSSGTSSGASSSSYGDSKGE